VNHATTNLSANATGNFGRINNVSSWHRCHACEDKGLALFDLPTGVASAPCPLCIEGERRSELWRSKPRRYGPPVAPPIDLLVTGSVE
jgi:hypothetical protein